MRYDKNEKLSNFKRSYLLEEVLLYAESIVGCNALAGLVNIAVCKSLFSDMLWIRAVEAVLVGICKILHNENNV